MRKLGPSTGECAGPFFVLEHSTGSPRSTKRESDRKRQSRVTWPVKNSANLSSEAIETNGLYLALVCGELTIEQLIDEATEAVAMIGFEIDENLGADLTF